MGVYLPWFLRNLFLLGFFFFFLVTCALAQLGKRCFMTCGWKREAESETFGSGQAEGGV